MEKISGVIIKTQDYSETHKIVTVFSEKIGKFSAIARGAKKPKSRMAALTQPFVHGQFLVYLTKGLSTLQQGEIVQSFRSIREDIIKTAYAAYVAELTDKLLDSQQDDVFLYQQFYQTLSWIAENEDVEIPVMMYEMKLYDKGGFAPVVDQCVNCHTKESPFYFSIQEGGFLCQTCSTLDAHAVKLPDALAKLFFIFLNVGIDQVGQISVKSKNQQFMRKWLDAYYDRYGGYFLKSRKFLTQLDKLQ